MDFTERERRFMRLALEEAERALNEGEVPVGCVLVLGDKVIGRGSNKTNVTRNGTRHCEFEAIDEVLRSGNSISWSEVELFVTCEPCIMCAGALSNLGIKSVYYGCCNDTFGGCGTVLPVSTMGCGSCGGGSRYTPGTDFECFKGLFAEEAVKLLQDFYMLGNPQAPKPHRRIGRR